MPLPFHTPVFRVILIVIAHRILVLDVSPQVTGRAKFAADYNAVDQLYGKVLRSE
jgi:CO/xanthine dehydrogenase Mo-binding subunit